MKKLFTVFFIFGIFYAEFDFAFSAPAVNSVPWWEQPTVCRTNPTNCYTSMGAGFDTGMWDANSNCWGLKMICSEATTANDSEPVAMGKSQIANGTGIKSDFDINILNGDCFGARKTASNGSVASVDGNFVNVWCNGILDNPTETVQTGEIQTGTQPTCKDLARNGWVGVVNQRCYGKYFDPSKYYIECEGDNLLPKRIVVLNGSDKVIGRNGTVPSVDYPTDTAAATTLFDKMQSVSANKKSKYF